MINKKQIVKMLNDMIENVKKDAHALKNLRAKENLNMVHSEIAFDIGYISALCHVLGKGDIAQELQDKYMD
tara:strand:+ start:22 stop:234 length:213 start_codon:yes stop_codon:yes gene_type:complete